MKKINKIVFFILSIILISACGNNNAVEEVFSLKYNDITINLGEEFDQDKLGKELNYSETQSCAFEGLDKTYTYEHFEITTNPINDKDKIGSIYFLDDAISTTEGIKKGDSYEKMLKTYGDNYTLDNSLYTYTKENTKLQFLVQDETIISIEYLLSN